MNSRQGPQRCSTNRNTISRWSRPPGPSCCFPGLSCMHPSRTPRAADDSVSTSARSMSPTSTRAAGLLSLTSRARAPPFGISAGFRTTRPSTRTLLLDCSDPLPRGPCWSSGHPPCRSCPAQRWPRARDNRYTTEPKCRVPRPCCLIARRPEDHVDPLDDPGWQDRSHGISGGALRSNDQRAASGPAAPD